MKILRTKNELCHWRNACEVRAEVGFVPTMGALHEGHLTLMKRARAENAIAVASIFINPTQFGPKEDLSRYPRTLEEDLALLRRAEMDAVFVPETPAEIYVRSFDSWVEPRKVIAEILEGRFRPGHFRGVTTVCSILFHLTRPTRAYFGEKDYQQLKIIEAMVEDLAMPLTIVPVKTVRAESGLALSSRNRYLTEEHRTKAALLHRALSESPSPEKAKQILEAEGFEVQYLEVWNSDLTAPSTNNRGRWLAAVLFGGVRLIDNVEKN